MSLVRDSGNSVASHQLTKSQQSPRCGVLDARNPLKAIGSACQDKVIWRRPEIFKLNEKLAPTRLPVDPQLNSIASPHVPATRSFSKFRSLSLIAPPSGISSRSFCPPQRFASLHAVIVFLRNLGYYGFQGDASERWISSVSSSLPPLEPQSCHPVHNSRYALVSLLVR